MKPQLSTDSIGTIEAVNRTLSNTDDVRTNVRSALEALATGMGCTYAFFAILDDNADSFQLAETFGLNLSNFRRLESNIKGPMFRSVFESGVAARVDLTQLG